MMTRFSLVMAMSAATLFGLAACGTDPCTRESPCPNDVPRTQAQKDQCSATLKANENSACYSEAVSFTNCTIDNLVCGGNGKTDLILSATQTTNNCTNQKADYVACCTKNRGATACP
jgi:hypothetical protein